MTATTRRPKITAAEKAARRDECAETLLDVLPPTGARIHVDTLYGRSGMSRSVRVFYAAGPGDIRDITWYVGHACGYDVRDDDGGRRVIRMNGCGYSSACDIAHALQHYVGLLDVRYSDL